MDQTKQSILVVGVVVVITGVSYFFISKPNNENASAGFAATKEIEESKEKTYTAEVNYRVPRGNEIIKVELTLIEDEIVDSKITHSHFDSHSTPHMEAFNQGYVDEVVGKNINEVDLDIISGASLTTLAFMTALEDIKEQI